MTSAARGSQQSLLLDLVIYDPYDPAQRRDQDVLSTPPTAFLSRMQLLVAVINHAEKVDDVLAGFVELGITGATVVGSEGMGHVLSHDVPIFAGVRTLSQRSRPTNQTVFSVIDDALVEAAIALIQDVCGDLDSPGAGIVFTIPVARVVGLAPELEG
jgi:nitrogen regulatory protein P-II 1